MTTARVTDLTELTVKPAATDLVHVVDVSDTTDHETGSSRKLTIAKLLGGGNILRILGVSPTATAYATPDIRTGGSTPTEVVQVWDFDDTTIEYLDLKVQLSSRYAGGGLTLALPWSATIATTGVCRWGAAFRRMQDDTIDIDDAKTYDYNDVDDTTASASGRVSCAVISFSDGADMDSLAAGEIGILRIRRNASHANDNLSGDAELWGVLGTEA